MMNQNYDDTRTKVLIENTAQGVFKHHRESNGNSKSRRREKLGTTQLGPHTDYNDF